MRRIRIPGLFAVLVSVLLLSPVLAQSSDPASARTGTDARPAVVTGTAVNVRSGPGTGYDVLTRVDRDDQVRILEERDGWSHIRLGDGSNGWISSKYLAPAEATGEEAPAAAPAAAPAKSEAARSMTASERGKGGGSVVGSVFKWGCLAGALVAGGVAWNEHSQGNDAYDEYKAMFDSGGRLVSGNTTGQAEDKRQEAIDHDGSATTWLIVSGTLFGAFLFQQLRHGGSDDVASESPAGSSLSSRSSLSRASASMNPIFSFTPQRGGWRAGLVARF